MRRANVARSMRVSVLLLVAVVGVAGCLDGSSDDNGSDDEKDDGFDAADYDAIEAAIGEPLTDGGLAPGAPSSYNLERVATVTGDRLLPPQPADGYLETAVKGGYAYVCR